MNDRGGEATIGAVGAAAMAGSIERARRQWQRDPGVTTRARAAGWSTGPAAWGSAAAVSVGVFGALLAEPTAGTGGWPVLLLLALIPPVLHIVQDLRRGPLAKAHQDGRWTGAVCAALIGAAAGLAGGAIAGTVTAESQGCPAASFGDCGYGLMLAASVIGPVIATGVTAAVLAVLQVRHALLITALGVTGAATLAALLSQAAPAWATPGVPLFVVAGTLGYGLAGTALARNLAPMLRCTALVVLLALTLLTR